MNKGFLTKSNLAQIDPVTGGKKSMGKDISRRSLFAIEPQTWGWFAPFWLAKPLQKHLVESVLCHFGSEFLLDYKPNTTI